MTPELLHFTLPADEGSGDDDELLERFAATSGSISAMTSPSLTPVTTARL
jgi:hypothetical protein